MLNFWIKYLLAFALFFGAVFAFGRDAVSLALNGKANYVIVTPSKSTVCEKYAAEELKRYLLKLSKADFKISDKILRKSIVVSAVSSLPESLKSLKELSLSGESFIIFKQKDTIYLVGGNPEGTLYAVYNFLNKLGCCWIAPDFEFFEGSSELVPFQNHLNYTHLSDQTFHPSLKYRKLYIEEGLSHDAKNLLKIIEWMPKARFNILVSPINYEGNGRVQWNNWREDLIPELKKRGIIIEVGGHGYQNFLNSKMNEGQLFKTHPEWFGMDKDGNRTPDSHVVFCSSNQKAFDYLLGNVLAYLKAHPEIDIFDFWPPDSEKWCECGNCKEKGTAAERHIILVSQMAKSLKKQFPNVKLECIAYSRYVEPPKNAFLDEHVLLDFCPINQSFEHQIYQDSSINNLFYKENLLKWLKVFKGDISIYSYYRKYAWRSLPNIIPHYMQKELQYYHEIGAKGISVYSEPGDWFTYGLNHYVLGQIAWNKEVDVDSLTTEYCKILYGPFAKEAVSIYSSLENIVRYGCSLPYTAPKTTKQYQLYLTALNNCKDQVKEAISLYSSVQILSNHLKRLLLMLEYSSKNITMIDIKTNIGNQEELNRINADIKKMMDENAHSGVFIPR